MGDRCYLEIEVLHVPKDKQAEFAETMAEYFGIDDLVECNVGGAGEPARYEIEEIDAGGVPWLQLLAELGVCAEGTRGDGSDYHARAFILLNQQARYSELGGPVARVHTDGTCHPGDLKEAAEWYAAQAELEAFKEAYAGG